METLHISLTIGQILMSLQYEVGDPFYEAITAVS